MNNLLAIDTSTENCSVALWARGRIIEEGRVAPQKHAELVLSMVDSVLEQAMIKREDLDGLVIGVGPGSFTGVRVAASAAQGLALGLNLKVAGVSSLKSLAAQALKGADEKYAIGAIDARMGEVYVAVYQRKDGKLETLLPETVLKPEEAVDKVRGAIGIHHAVGGGTGMELLYGAGLNKNIQKRSYFPDAESIVELGLIEFSEGRAKDPEEALPLYVRDEVAWKKTAEQHKA